MSIKLLLVILAIVFFLLDAVGFVVTFRTPPTRIFWTPLAFACLTAAVFLPI